MVRNLSIIVAIAENYAIGKDNKLLCHISEDLKRFKKLTSGHTVIMGKNTYDSLPVKPLPNRKNIVISDNPKDNFPGCIMTYSIYETIEKSTPDDENFIIGGASIYRQFLPHANKLYLTRINKHFDADTYFPEINYKEWKLIEKEENILNYPELQLGDNENNFTYNYETYVRIL